ncbi:hypothetical protein F511_31182 [Dorcoceras hygrometricum]|uniref:Uncharacterized protein n=1 Tax=Dorcoceras hygrometricum TaxID=472368 RepID=A0A2Z7CDT7_9LAMI|nr:hypothetical protein F511_31182 [Dorcoceras hygrometricum]
MVVTKDVFAEAFGLPTEGMVRFIDLPTQSVAEMRMRFCSTDVSFKVPNKKNEMEVEYRLLHDIMAKALCTKAGSFDVILVATVHTSNRQSQGFAVQMSVMLERLVKADLGENIKMHPLKFLNHKSVLTYMNKNLAIGPSGESSKQIGETASAADSMQSLALTSRKKSTNWFGVIGFGIHRVSPSGENYKETEDTEEEAGEENYGDQAASNPGPAPEIPAEAENDFTLSTLESNVKSREVTKAQEVNNESSNVVRSEPEQPAQHSTPSAEKRIFAPVEIREINWVTHFLPKIDPADKGK